MQSKSVYGLGDRAHQELLHSDQKKLMCENSITKLLSNRDQGSSWLVRVLAKLWVIVDAGRRTQLQQSIQPDLSIFRSATSSKLFLLSDKRDCMS